MTLPSGSSPSHTVTPLNDHSRSAGSMDSAMRLRNHSETRDAGHKEDWLECRHCASRGRGGDITRHRSPVGDPMYHQLESRRFQQDVIVITMRFGETEHGRIEGRYPIWPPEGGLLANGGAILFAARPEPLPPRSRRILSAPRGSDGNRLYRGASRTRLLYVPDLPVPPA
jgi:hypothetical protein